MPTQNKKLFLQEYIGLGNRLETLALAFAIQAEHGHQILLDWPELDALVIKGTTVKSPGFWGRLGALRLREVSPETFAGLGRYKKILLRTYLGPDNRLTPVYRQTIEKICIRRPIAEEIQAIFAPLEQRAVIGVHIRRGDYPLNDPDTYDTNSARHPAVPLWWYEQAMASLLKQHKDAVFYLSFSGQGSEFNQLRKNFDIIQAHSRSPYVLKDTGHNAEYHPVVDLFSLACCSILLATPLSSFSHYAANLLGPKTVCLVPPLRVTRTDWAMARIDLPGKRLIQWTLACRSGSDHRLVKLDCAGFEGTPPSTVWLPVSD